MRSFIIIAAIIKLRLADFEIVDVRQTNNPGKSLQFDVPVIFGSVVGYAFVPIQLTEAMGLQFSFSVLKTPTVDQLWIQKVVYTLEYYDPQNMPMMPLKEPEIVATTPAPAITPFITPIPDEEKEFKLMPKWTLGDVEIKIPKEKCNHAGTIVLVIDVKIGAKENVAILLPTGVVGANTEYFKSVRFRIPLTCPSQRNIGPKRGRRNARAVSPAVIVPVAARPPAVIAPVGDDDADAQRAQKKEKL